MSKRKIAELQEDLAKGRELLRRMREMREGAEHDLIIMRPYEGTSTVVDANIQHKRDDAALFRAEEERLEKEVARIALEITEAQRETEGEQQSLLDLGL